MGEMGENIGLPFQGLRLQAYTPSGLCRGRDGARGFTRARQVLYQMTTTLAPGSTLYHLGIKPSPVLSPGAMVSTVSAGEGVLIG